MICLPCREAGSLLKFRTGATARDPLGAGVYLEQQAILLHKECRGGTWCDCQHQLDGVNWPEVTRAAAGRPA